MRIKNITAHRFFLMALIVILFYFTGSSFVMAEDKAKELYSKGLSFVQVEDYEKALPCFEKAAKENPNYADAYRQIGDCNGELGRWNEAIKAYKQAIRIVPDYALAHFSLGVVYVAVGDKNAAFDEYKILKDLNQDMAKKLFALIYE